MAENLATFRDAGLPFELVQEVIDYYEDDPTTLRSICLVSKSWRQAAVIHLFSKIQLSDEEDFEMWLEIIRRTQGLGSRRLKRVSHYRIGITEDGSDDDDDEETKSAKSRSSDSSSLLLAKIPPTRVDMLRCWLQHDDRISFTPAVSQYLSKFTAINALDFANGQFTTHLDFVKFLAACGKLENLEIDQADVDDDTAPSQCSISLDISSLKSIKLRECSHRLLDLLFSQPAPRSLVSLTINNHADGVPWETHGRFIDAVASTLEYLHFDPADEGGHFGRLNQPLPALGTLELEFFGDYAKIEDFLGNLPSAPKLAHLMLEFVYSMTSDLLCLENMLKRSDWDNFMTFVTGQFPAFQQFTFRVRVHNGRIDNEAVASLVQKYVSHISSDPSRFKLEILPTK
ncbi:hypothetical protein C8J56DRAFT_196589 [Mycena floridula]|nr:hypothetical protein C8J56DRAFT_196589 [Mycena floridula]